MEKIKKYIYYLNINELKIVAEKYHIPYHVYYKENNLVKKSPVLLKKRDIIKNILEFLNNKQPHKFIIKSNLVNFNKVENLKLRDYVYFGQFNYKTAKDLITPLLNHELEGAIIFLMIYDLWKKQRLFTYQQLAIYYNKYYYNYKEMEHPEWAYLTDLSKKNIDIQTWKNYRKEIAKKVINLIRKILK